MSSTITHLITGLGTGGAEKQLALILPHLTDKDTHRIISLGEETALARSLQARGVEVVSLGNVFRFSPATFYTVWHLLKSQQPTILITYLFHADMVGRIVGRLAGIPRIISSQRSSHVGRNWVYRVERYTAPLVTAYVTQTQAAKQKLIAKSKIPPHKIFVIPNAVKLPDLQKSPNRPVKVFTCVANLKEGKGHTELLHAFKDLRSSFPGITLWLIGDGPLNAPLRELAQKLSISDHVKFWGTRNDVDSLLARSDVFVLPTHGEGMSNAILEAMSYGLPCVVSDIATNKELAVDAAALRFHRVGDAIDLHNALEEVATSEIMRKELSQNAREVAQQNHSINTISQAWESLYSQMNNL